MPSRLSGTPAKLAQHPVCRELLDEMGAQGKAGNDIRKRFTCAGYGWPQDAVDGGLLALMAANLVEATGKNGKGLTVKEIAQSQIGVIRFRRTSIVVSAGQRLAVRHVLADIGYQTKVRGGGPVHFACVGSPSEPGQGGWGRFPAAGPSLD